jgi:uncharacterized protein YjbI with pentapeptide repeats
VPVADLRADCSRCFALCCVVPAFSASSDFAIDKPAGRPCPNLLADCRCGIHGELRSLGFRGCTVYDCFGAGQQVSQGTFEGRQDPRMVDVFPVVRQLHELLWYLTEAAALPSSSSVRSALGDALLRTRELAGGDPDALLALDVGAHRQDVNALLLRASELFRAGSRGVDHRGADLIGAKLKGADLRKASLRGALLIGADLRGADLRQADVIGADFRTADLRGADLTGALYLIQSQLDSAKGDSTTTLPPGLNRPGHWS